MPTLPHHSLPRAVSLTATFALLAVCGACARGVDERGDSTAAVTPGTSPGAATQETARGTAPAARTKAPPQVDPGNVNASVQWDPATKTAIVPNVTALTSSAGGWNFNGYANGNATLVVPLGATVEMEYYNGNGHPHSVGIVPGSPNQIPSTPGDPAFPNAISTRFIPGMAPNTRDVLRFKADKPGTYLMVCGVPGHALSGMWVKFQVSSSAREPTWRTS